MTKDELKTAVSTLISQGETHIHVTLAEDADVSYIATALEESNASKGSIFLTLNGAGIPNLHPLKNNGVF